MLMSDDISSFYLIEEVGGRQRYVVVTRRRITLWWRCDEIIRYQLCSKTVNNIESPEYKKQSYDHHFLIVSCCFHFPLVPGCVPPHEFELKTQRDCSGILYEMKNTVSLILCLPFFAGFGQLTFCKEKFTSCSKPCLHRKDIACICSNVLDWCRLHLVAG